MIKHKSKIVEIYCMLIILFPFATLFQNYVSFSNIALLTVVVYIMIAMIIGHRYIKIKHFSWIVFSSIIWIVAMLNTPRHAL